MSVNNDRVEGSTFLDPMRPVPKRDNVVSLEDQAWADSCFVGDSEVSNSDWDSFKNALEEIGTSRWVHLPVSKVHSPVSEINYLASPSVGRTDDNASSDDGEEKEEDSDSNMVLDKIIKSKLKKTNGVYPFRPNYNEHLQENENSDLGLELDFFDFTGDQLAEDIFKVWDLDIPAEEEDELVTKQLIPEIPIEILPATSDDFEALKDLKDDSLDDLINGISELSLDMQLESTLRKR